MPYKLGSQTIYHYGEEGSGFELSSGGQEFRKIRKSCLAKGILFEDPQFPAEYRSIYNEGVKKEKTILWLRPSEMVEDPQFFSDGVSRFDVNQGNMGNCWFIASVANLTLDKKIFHQVIPEDNSFEEGRYCGAFHFQFWKFGRWIEVVVDDRLPTSQGKLLFMHSEDRSEFWSALVEKAYAKLHSCYEALDGGRNIEALVDFTGGLAELFAFHEIEPPKNLFQIMLKSYERGSLMGCSLKGDAEAEGPQGLVLGHAYTITSVNTLELNGNEIPMIRIRNPWGHSEWTGRWSDNSREWKQIDDNIKLNFDMKNKMDGEFWMCYEDFVELFSSLEVCHLGPHGLISEDVPVPKKKWEMQVFEDEWVRGATAGGCVNYPESFPYNPQFTIEITDPDPDDDEDKCTLIVALMQKFRRSQKTENASIGFSIYKTDGAENVSKPLRGKFFQINQSAARTDTYTNSREVSGRFKLFPGTYCIIPTCFEKNIEGEFLLRVFSETSHNMEINDIDQPVDIWESKDWDDLDLSQDIVDIFNTKADESGNILLTELQEILNHNFQVGSQFNGFSEPLYRLLVDAVGEGKDITLDMLTNSWKILHNFCQIFLELDLDGSGYLSPFELWPALKKAAFKIKVNYFVKLLQKFGDENKNIYFDNFLASLLFIMRLKAAFQNGNERTDNKDFNFQTWLEIECEKYGM